MRTIATCHTCKRTSEVEVTWEWLEADRLEPSWSWPGDTGDLIPDLGDCPCGGLMDLPELVHPLSTPEDGAA